MKHVFIAVGGSGTKVAEALVKLLAIGFPTRLDDRGRLTSAGDSLEIWRVDPDRSSGAFEDLNNTLREYRLMQNSLNGQREQTELAGSHWSIEIDSKIRDLNPLELPKINPRDNQVNTLGGILNSHYTKDLEDSLPLLRPFYEEKDLTVPIDEGFYQKPFIGAAIMAIFARSLEAAAADRSGGAWIQAFDNTKTNFFLCGSLHGGTGASGVPVMAQFLKGRKVNNPEWRIGGCMLTPYFRPPAPPFKRSEGDVITQENLDDKTDEYFRQYHEHPAFEGTDEAVVKKIVRLILQDYYADPEEIVPRARQGMEYYRRYGASLFDEMYLVGKPSPNNLINWSNGGSSQKNPLNSTEVVAAISALNFFSGNRLGDNDKYVIASASSAIDSEKMNLANLPPYKVITDRVETDVNPEMVFLSTALLYYLVSHQLPWPKAYEATSAFRLFSQYKENPDGAGIDEKQYKTAMEYIRRFLESLLQPHETSDPTGWGPDGAREIQSFFNKKLQRKWLRGSYQVLPDRLGRSEANLKIFEDFASWAPDGNFTRGEYLRDVWANILDNCGKN